MKLCRFGLAGREKPGLIDADGRIRDLSAEIGDIDPPGVWLGQKPEPWFLKPGDVVTLGIEKLGDQRQRFAAFSREALA